MEKKRRDFKNCEIVHLDDTANGLADCIAAKTKRLLNHGVEITEYHLHPRYGVGTITTYSTEEIDVAISRFHLKKDMMYLQSFLHEILQVSFLISGEKMISMDSGEEIVYESKESYMAIISQFSGSSKILANQPFTEIKIKLPKEFLMKHGFVSHKELKKLTDENLILPITDELLSIVLHLERKDFTGIGTKLYLKAKVFELMAIQLEHYKNKNAPANRLTQDKTLKKLYSVRQTIKNFLHLNFTLQQLGDGVGITGHVLNKEFIRVFGTSVHEFSTAEKMSKAKKMLENTKKPIYQIAEEIGYRNATHFSAAFKRFTGKIPSAFRTK